MGSKKKRLPSIAKQFLARVIACAVIAIAGGTNVAGFAQILPDRFDQPLFSENEVAALEESLGLNEPQVEAQRAILTSFVAWQKDAKIEYERRLTFVDHMWGDAAKRIEHALAVGDYQAMSHTDEEVRAMKEYQAWRDALNEEGRQRRGRALSEVASTLNDRQRPLWNEYLRDRLRNRTLTKGAHFAVEGVDLKDLFTEQLDLSSQGKDAIAPVLLEYSRAIDPILVRRNETLRVESTLPRPHEGPEMERLDDLLHKNEVSIDDYSAQVSALAIKRREEELKRWDLLFADHRAIRDLTLDYFDACIRLLPGEMIEPARRAFEEEAYSYIVRPLPLDKIIEEALAHEDLHVNQRSAIENIRDSQWKPARHQIDVQLMRLKDRDDEQWKEKRRDEADPSIEVRQNELLAQRRSILKLYLGQVHDLLTDAQAATLNWPALDDAPVPGLPGTQPGH